MTRTSQTDPIRIAEINTGGGTIGVTFAPGKDDRRSYGGFWARDLDRDLDAVAAWGATTVVTLLEPEEMRKLAILRLGAEVERRGIAWIHAPIPDLGTPGPAFEAGWPDLSRRLRTLLDAGDKILIHCRGGLGRAGTIAARLLAETGVDPDVAMERVRAVRPDAIDLGAQERWVRMGPRGRASGTTPA